MFARVDLGMERRDVLVLHRDVRLLIVDPLPGLLQAPENDCVIWRRWLSWAEAALLRLTA